MHKTEIRLGGTNGDRASAQGNDLARRHRRGCAASRPLRTNTQRRRCGRGRRSGATPHPQPRSSSPASGRRGTDPRWAAPGARRLGREQKVCGELAGTEATWRPGTRFPSGNFRAAGALGPHQVPPEPGACISLQVTTPGLCHHPGDE